VDAFNLIVGVVGVAGVLFSIWTWLDGRRKEAVETEKSTTNAHRLADMLGVVNAAAQQTAMTANLSDRDAVTKKELKHLLVANLATLKAAQDGLARIHATRAAWRYGLVDHYLADDELQPAAPEFPVIPAG
jgi:hypothetical protein